MGWAAEGVKGDPEGPGAGVTLAPSCKLKPDPEEANRARLCGPWRQGFHQGYPATTSRSARRQGKVRPRQPRRKVVTFAALLCRLDALDHAEVITTGELHVSTQSTQESKLIVFRVPFAQQLDP